MRVLPSPRLFLPLLLALCLQESVSGPARAAGPVDSGAEAPPAAAGGNETDSDPASGPGGMPAGNEAQVFGAQSGRYSYAPALEESLRDARAATSRFQLKLDQSEHRLQTLHSLDELADALHRHPGWKLRLRRAERGPGARLSPDEWDPQSRDVYPALREKGVPSSRLE